MRKATTEWLKSAGMDLDSVAQIVHLVHLTPVVAFHAQQCVEDVEEFYRIAKNIYDRIQGLYGSTTSQ